MVADAAAQGSIATDRAALEALYDTTGGPGWTEKIHWKTSVPLGDWYGVTTDTVGRVIELDLNNNGLIGSIPSVLQDLVNLEVLHLQENALTGQIPDWLGDLSRLRSLALGGSGLTGPIPGGLSKLTNLDTLYLWGLGLTGPIPSWLGGLGNLRRLSLIRNQLTGAIPPELGDLAYLHDLWLSQNPLTGMVPASLMQLSLRYFWIHETGVCVSSDAAFRAWVATIESFRGDTCASSNPPPGSFTDHPIVPGVTPVRAVHFTELRARIDAVRVAAGLEAYGWMDPVLTSGVTPVRLGHLLDLRSALAEAYAVAGQSGPLWTDATPRVGTTPIRSAHLMELRAAVESLNVDDGSEPSGRNCLEQVDQWVGRTEGEVGLPAFDIRFRNTCSFFVGLLIKVLAWDESGKLIGRVGVVDGDYHSTTLLPNETRWLCDGPPHHPTTKRFPSPCTFNDVRGGVLQALSYQGPFQVAWRWISYNTQHEDPDPPADPTL